MNLRETLTKENFFNNMMELYPNATKQFCNWIDEYKKEVNWNKLFNSDSDYQDANGKNAPAPKFHELPNAFQQGIWMEYCRQVLSNIIEQPEHFTDSFDLEEDIKNVFEAIEEVTDDSNKN